MNFSPLNTNFLDSESLLFPHTVNYKVPSVELGAASIPMAASRKQRR
jgi:hypothetical protein